MPYIKISGFLFLIFSRFAAPGRHSFQWRFANDMMNIKGGRDDITAPRNEDLHDVSHSGISNSGGNSEDRTGSNNITDGSWGGDKDNGSDDKIGPRILEREGRLGAGEGVSFVFRLPALESPGQPLMYDVNIMALAARELRKSNRPHLFAMAFVLDKERNLRSVGDDGIFAQVPRPSFASAASSSHLSTNQGDLIWSAVKLRNATGARSDAEPPMRFRVPLGREPSTLHVLLASNYVGIADGLGVPFRVCITAPPEETRPLQEEATPTESESAARRTPPLLRVGNPRRVLCIDGGGSKGVLPLEVLAELERRSGRRTRDQFDMFCGTSTGSIVAAGLALADFPISVMTRLYIDLASVIFGSRVTSAQRSCRLRAILSCIFGEHTSLSAAAATAAAAAADTEGSASDSKMRQKKSAKQRQRQQPKYFCAVATDMSTMQFRPYVFRSYVPAGAGNSALHDGLSYQATVVDAIMSSTAAPTYFTQWNVTIGGELRRLTDGGLVGNNPTHFALLEAAELAFERRCVGGEELEGVSVVLSLGCGASPAAAMGRGSGSVWSLNNIHAAGDLLAGIFNLMTDTDMTHEIVKRMLQCQGMRLGEEYHRFNTVLDARHMKMDEADPNSLRDMQLLARDFLRKEKANDFARLIRRLHMVHPDNHDNFQQALAREHALREEAQRLRHERQGLAGQVESNGGDDSGGVRVMPYFVSGADSSDGGLTGTPLHHHPPPASSWLTPSGDHTDPRWKWLFGESAPPNMSPHMSATSKPIFRNLRKRASRATGMCGFFSGKKKIQPSG